MTFTFQDVLEREGIAPEDVNVLLHSPKQPALQATLSSLVKTRRGAMEAYQATHPGMGAQGALKSGRPWVAALVKVGQDVPSSHSLMLFAGLYRNEGWRERRSTDILAEPDVAFLLEGYGVYRALTEARAPVTCTWFDLVLDDRLEAMQGRLLVSVRLTPNYIRRAENIDAPVRAIHQTGIFEAAPPHWRSWIVTAAALRALSDRWRDDLSKTRGVYLILDHSDGARYVGSAYGLDNMLGRWLTHVAGEVGVTVRLADRNPVNFRFSILERVSPDAPAEEVIALEQTWMERLGTVEFGLNRSAEMVGADGEQVDGP